MLRPLGLAAALALIAAPFAARADLMTATFEDLNVAPNSVKMDFGHSHEFSSGGFTFNNTYSGYLAAGFAVSSQVNNNPTVPAGNTDPYYDYDNLQFGAYSPVNKLGGTGSGNSPTYAIAYAYAPTDATIELPSGFAPKSIDVANTTYLVSSLLYGDAFNKHAFAPGDYLKLDILGFSGPGATGNQVGDVAFYLVGDAAGDMTYAKQFTTVDLSSLLDAKSLGFVISSNVVDPILGPTLPFEFALDNVVAIRAVPEPSGWVLFALGCGILGLIGYARQRRGISLDRNNGPDGHEGVTQ